MTVVFYTKKKFKSDDFILLCYKKYCKIFDVSEEEIVIDRSEIKPMFVKDGKITTPYFSLSHSGEYIVCGMGEKPIGIDIQQHKEVDFFGLSTRFFGKAIVDKQEFFDEFVKGEATVKRYNISFIEGMKRREGEVFYKFYGHSFALCGDEVLSFSEI